MSGDDLQSAHSDFTSACDELWDKAFRLWTKSKREDFAYREEIAEGPDLYAADRLFELISVLNDERQADILTEVRKLFENAFFVGASRAIEGLDPTVEARRKDKMKVARAGRKQFFTCEKEDAIQRAIVEYGPKIANIRKALHKKGIDVSDDAVRDRKNAALNA